MNCELDNTKLYRHSYSGLKEVEISLFDALTTISTSFDPSKRWVIDCIVKIVRDNGKVKIEREDFAINYGDTKSLPRITDMHNDRHFRIDPYKKIVLVCKGDGTGFWRDADKIPNILYYAGTVENAVQEFHRRGYFLAEAELIGYKNINRSEFEKRGLNVNEWYVIKRLFSIDSLNF